MHGRRALSEQDCWSDIGGVVLRERQCHDSVTMVCGRPHVLHSRAIFRNFSVTPPAYGFVRISRANWTGV